MPTKSLIEVKGLGTASVNKLLASGILSLDDLVHADISRLMGVTGFGEKRTASLLASARQLLGAAADSGPSSAPGSASETKPDSEKPGGTPAQKQKKKKNGKGKKKKKGAKKKKAKNKDTKDKNNKKKKKKEKKDGKKRK